MLNHNRKWDAECTVPSQKPDVHTHREFSELAKYPTCYGIIPTINIK